MPNRQVSESQSGMRPEEDGHIGEPFKALTEKLADLVGVRLKKQLPMEALTQMALVACTADLYTFEDIIDSPEDETKAFYAGMSPGQATALRMLMTAEQQKTQKPKPAKPQFPGVRIRETARRHPTLNTIGAKLMPTQEAVDFFTKLKHETALIEPPYTMEEPNLMEEPWAPCTVEFKKAVDANVARKKRYGIEEHHPTLAHVALAQLRAEVADEIAGAWARFGCIGTHLTNMAEILETIRAHI